MADRGRQRVTEIARRLKRLPDTPATYEANHKEIKLLAFVVGWRLSEPYAQWDYWHCFTNNGRGIVRLSIAHLIAELIDQDKVDTDQEPLWQEYARQNKQGEANEV